jgi:hypothetical protein
MAEVFEIEGLSEVNEALKSLPDKLRAEVWRALNKKAVKQFVVDKIRNTISYSSESEKGITVKNYRNNATGVVGGLVGSAGYKIRWADKGTATRFTQNGAYRGAIIGRNQIEPIVLGSIPEITNFMNTEVGNIINEILEKKIKTFEKKIAKLEL